MRNLFLFLFLIFFMGCSSPQALPKKGVISIDVEKDVVSIKEFIAHRDSLKILPLKSSEIGSITQIAYSDGRYYILSTFQNILYVFDSLGNSLFKIDKRGKAKGEYDMLGGFTLLSNAIRMWDVTSNQMIDYSIEDGSFIAEYSLGRVGSIASNGDVMAFYRNDDEPMVISVYDGSMNKLYDGVRGYPKKNQNVFISSYFPFCVAKNEIYFTNDFLNEIYVIGRDSVSLKYTLDFGAANMTEKMYDRFVESSITGMKDIKCVVYVDSFQLTEEAMSFLFVYAGKFYSAYYNRETEKASIIYIATIGEEDSVDTRLFYTYVNHTIDDNGFLIGYVNSSALTDELMDKYRENDPLLAERLTEAIQSNDDEYEYYLLLQKYK